MQSPPKNFNKKTPRKQGGNTFSQPTVQTEVGDFKGGYFVMSSPVNKDDSQTNLKRSTTLKEHDANPKDTINLRKSTSNLKQERSPGRRKHQTNESTADVLSKFNEHARRHSMPSIVDVPTKTYNIESPKKRASTILSTSPPALSASTRWAGPAFGNAPPPSSLPLPDWTPVASPLPTPPAQTSYQVQQHGMTFQPLSSSPPQYVPHPLSTSSPIPAVPFPYVHSSPVLSSVAPAPSLAQLSTDLRRLLNIGAGPDLILVSANSS